jgi:hypothetical protein
MEQKYRKFYVEWWKIRKSTIYGLAAFIIVSAAVVFGGWYAIRHNWFVAEVSSDLPKDAARIISFEGDVRITRAATRETIIVTKETWVAAGDTIQTQADGRAIVQMIDQSVYSVRPNSTVVIRDNSSLFGGKNVRVTLDDGQLNVRTDQQPGDAENVVEMLDTETQLKPETDASFNADAAAKGGEIRISRGSVETTIGNSRTTINTGEFAAVNNGRISAREKLLAPPQPGAPPNASQLVDRTGSGVNVAFAWQHSDPNVSNYHLQVSRSSYFAADSILVDRAALSGRDFRLAGLSPGTYYWRLKASSRSGQASDWCEPAKFNVIRSGPSETIDARDWSVERVGGNVFIITGRTQPGMLIRAQGRETFAASDGAFRLQISTPLSEAAVEISDNAGSRAGFVISLRNSKVIRRY